MNPSNSPEIPFQPTLGPAANRMGALSSINQRQKIAPRSAPIPAPAPSAAATPLKRLNTGIKTNAEVYPQERDSSGQAESRVLHCAPTTGSRGRSSQVLPGPKEAEIRPDSRIPPNPPSHTATRTPDLDEDKDSRRARLGPNTGAPDAGTPLSGDSRDRSSQVPPSLITTSLGSGPLSGSDPLRAPGVGMAGSPTPRPYDSAATPWMNPSIPTYASVNPQGQHVNPYVPLDDHSLPSFAGTSTHPTGNNQNTVPTSKAQVMGGA